MAINKSVMMSDGGGSGKKKEPLISPSAKEVVDSLHAGEDIRSTQTPKVETPAVETPKKESRGGGQRTTQTTAPAATAPATPLPASSLQSGVDETRRLYDEAAAALAEKQKAGPSWSGSSYDAEIDDLYAQISGRGKFSYDLNKDGLWQQLKDSYGAAGKAAMTDTMGQAAALTGGYGSSYAQAVGQQAYDREIEKLLDAAPELEERAYARWQDEGDELKDKLSLARALSEDEFDKYLQERSEWLDERDFAARERDTAYEQLVTERGYGDSRTDANRSRVINLISIGYTPTEQELADAGMSREEYAVIAAQYAPKKSGGGGGSQKKSAYDQALADMQEAIKAGADQYEINTAIAANTSLTTEERRKLMDQNTAPISSRYIWDK